MSVPTGSVVTAVYVTSDSKDQVLDFYKSKFGSDANSLRFLRRHDRQRSTRANRSLS